jgi:hypothetical protein
MFMAKSFRKCWHERIKPKILDPMFAQVDTRVPHEVEAQVQSVYTGLFPGGDSGFVPRAFNWADECFSGRCPGYQAIDARYHDFEHTLQGTLCLARLLHQRQVAGARPELTQHGFELALLAILFHDTGYLKKRDDTDGTGAKYTLVHVTRSIDFAREFLLARNYSAEDVEAIHNMIGCTGVNVDLQTIRFGDPLERMLGCALATADLLGQMAAPDYVDKLPILYQEFAEGARHAGPRNTRYTAYDSADDLMRNTRSFWDNYVLPKIEDDFGGLYRFLNEPYPDGPNPYVQQIEDNLARLHKRLGQYAP